MVPLETYELLDCLVYDDNSTDTTGRYYIRSDDGTSISYDSTNKRIVLTERI